jgi:hypothetical protein
MRSVGVIIDRIVEVIPPASAKVIYGFVGIELELKLPSRAAEYKTLWRNDASWWMRRPSTPIV